MSLRTSWARAAAVAVALSALSGGPAVSAAGADAGPGCHLAHPATAHYAGGVALAPQPAGAPVPCGMTTGFAGGESAIAVTNDGAVFYAPAVLALAGVQTQYFLGGNSGFARTTDLGRTWNFVDPISTNLNPIATSSAGGYPAWDQIDDKFYVDRDTGRLFWADPDLPSEAVVSTDNDGLSWNYSVLPVGFGGEWTQVTTAKPRTSKPSGYPKVVYACGEYDSIGRNGDLCQKSLDGGQTWLVAGQGLFGSPANNRPQCAGQTEHPNFSPWAAPDSQGRLFELLYCAGKTFLLRSDDEGATWPVAYQVPFGIPAAGPNGTGAAELRSDSADNLYLAWADPGNPNPNSGYAPGVVYLAISRDLGRTWGPKMMVLAPGVAGIRTHFGFDVGAPGRVTFSYLGHRDGRNGFDGYITETSDALAARPLFWSAIANDTSEPALDAGGKGSSNGLGLDYVSAAIGPDGTTWASFWDACAADLPQSDPNCPADRNSPVISFGYGDFAGRLSAAPSSLAFAPGSLVALPGNRVCASRRNFGIRLRVPRRATVRRAIVRVNGRVVRVIRGARLRSRVDLRGLPRGRFTVRVTLQLASGRRVTERRTYHTCVPKRAPARRRG